MPFIFFFTGFIFDTLIQFFNMMDMNWMSELICEMLGWDY